MLHVETGGVGDVARALSAIDRGATLADEPTRAVLGGREARRVIFMGAPGVGKSTLLYQVIRLLRVKRERVAVLACDPVSSVSGGAFLGDRVRWSGLADDDGLFVRSVAHRDSDEHLADKLLRMIAVLERAGYGWVFVESVGSGQLPGKQLSIMTEHATTVVVLSPLCGDEIQMLKAGILESADLLVVNKMDLPGADLWRRKLEEMVALSSAETRVVPVTATKGEGVAELVAALGASLS